MSRGGGGGRAPSLHRAVGAPPPAAAGGPAAARSAERAELAALNDRFAAFLERVRALERQNGALRAALGRAAAAAPRRRAAGLLRDELRELRDRLQRLGRDRDRLQAERDGLAADLAALRQRLEDEVQKREDAEQNLRLFRKEVDAAALSRLELERRTELLVDEMQFVQKLRGEELRQLEARAQSRQAQARTPDLTAALRDIRTQYESIALRNLQEAHDWYQSKFADLSDAANRNRQALRLAKQERSAARRRIQSLACELDGLEGTNAALQREMRETEAAFGAEVGTYRAAVGRLEQEMERAKEEMGRHLREYQDLLHVKMALDGEIAAYRQLLEGEESRIAVPALAAAPVGTRHSAFEPEPAETHARRMVLVKTMETQDGQQVVTEMHKERAEPEQ
ncbi:peripherin [Struthio camelus]|uniref:peripherin n=1 Tax=Struthio camelus TaxID=8801 RepID=UPI003603E42B